MNLTIERAPALAALQRIIGVVDRKHTIMILANLVLTAEGETLSIRGTDLEMEMVETIPAMVIEDGAVTIPADKLFDIVRNSDVGSQISLRVDEVGHRVEVKSGRSRFNVPTLPVEDFPVYPAEGFGDAFCMPAKTLADMLGRVVTGVADQKLGNVLTNVYLRTTDDQLHAVGGSSHGVRLRREARPEGANLSAILPVKLVRQITSWLGEAEGDVEVRCAVPNEGRPASLLRLAHAATVLTANLDGAPGYVDYLKVLLEDHEVFASTDQDALQSAVKRALIMQDQKAKSVRLSFADGGLKIQARNDQAGEGEDEIAADYEGPPYDFLLNSDRLSDVMASLRGDAVQIGFALRDDPKDPNTAKVVIRAPSDTGYTAMLMQPRA